VKFFKILQLNFKSQCKLRVGKQILWQLGGMSELAANSGIIKISLALYKSDCDRHWTLNTLFFLTIYDKVAMWRCVMPFSLPSLKKKLAQSSYDTCFRSHRSRSMVESVFKPRCVWFQCPCCPLSNVGNVIFFFPRVSETHWEVV
jgi:hypothetical protein